MRWGVSARSWEQTKDQARLPESLDPVGRLLPATLCPSAQGWQVIDAWIECRAMAVSPASPRKSGRGLQTVVQR